jgi:hypothetical protein
VFAIIWLQRFAHLRPVLSTAGIVTAAALVLTGLSQRIGPAAPCVTYSALPDARCTPGEHYAELTPADVCTPGYAERLRAAGRMTTNTRDVVFANYGRPVAEDWVLNRLIPLSLGGTTGQRNLLPLPAEEAAKKLRLEATLHASVCGGQITLSEAQLMIARDWVAAYRVKVDGQER